MNLSDTLQALAWLVVACGTAVLLCALAYRIIHLA